MSGKKLKRYHRDIFFPEWADESLGKFLAKIIAGKSLSFSLHALERIVEYCFEYGKTLFKFIVSCSRKNALDAALVFEFYAVGKTIRKACFRYSSKNSPVDVIMVVSRDSAIITLFVANKDDDHGKMDVKLYEKE